MSKEVKLSLTFRTMDAMGIFTTKALLDCGATDSFIDKGAIEKYGLTVTKLSDPIPVYNADGGCNKLGDIDRYVELEMIFSDHKELMTLYATSLGKDSIFIGHDWLKKHNPDIDWTTGEVNMTRCPKTCGYQHRRNRAEKQKMTREKKKAERTRRTELDEAIKKFEHEQLQPSIEDVEDEYDVERHIRSYIVDPYEWDPSAKRLMTEEECDETYAELVGEKEWEEEEEEFMLNEQLKEQGVPRTIRRMIVRATTNKSTDIAAKANTEKKKKTFEEMVPEWFHDYKATFDKADFDELPLNRQWDHKIELNEGAKPWDNTRLILLSDDETKALDDFLEENLRTGRIKESKSPWASPFFFVKKKVGKLRPVHDYRQLNALTKKNQTP